MPEVLLSWDIAGRVRIENKTQFSVPFLRPTLLYKLGTVISSPKDWVPSSDLGKQKKQEEEDNNAEGWG